VKIILLSHPYVLKVISDFWNFFFKVEEGLVDETDLLGLS
jgi:hypothetical protein